MILTNYACKDGIKVSSHRMETLLLTCFASSVSSTCPCGSLLDSETSESIFRYFFLGVYVYVQGCVTFEVAILGYIDVE